MRKLNGLDSLLIVRRNEKRVTKKANEGKEKRRITVVQIIGILCHAAIRVFGLVIWTDLSAYKTVCVTGSSVIKMADKDFIG